MILELTRIAGVDLAGSPLRPTGFCAIIGKTIQTAVLFSDQEIIGEIRKINPGVVAIDAPLSLPPGRRRIEDRTGGHFRSCDLELRRRGIKFFPVTLGPMRRLTQRGLELKSELKNCGAEVVEIYPGGAQDIWGLPRARRDRTELALGLEKLSRRRFGLKLNKAARPWLELTSDELDAVTAALVGLLYLRGQADLYGRGKKIIVMPPGKRTGPNKKST